MKEIKFQYFFGDVSKIFTLTEIEQGKVREFMDRELLPNAKITARIQQDSMEG